MRGAKVLVTGSNGFIGSAIVKKLIELGNEVNVFIRKTSDRSRLKNVLNEINIIETDIVYDDRISNYIKRINPDIIYHLAGFGVYSYFNNDEKIIKEMIESNIQGTSNLLIAAQKTNCKLFINTGSCYEYGSSEIPFDEGSFLQPTSVYGSTKAATTLITNSFFRSTHLPVVTVRPFTVYGPEEDRRRFISSVILKCLQNENPKLIKNTIVRDFVYIEDVVDGYIRIAEQHVKVLGEIINISTGYATSLLDAAKMIIRLTKANVQIDIGGYPMHSNEVEFLVGNPKKAERIISWKANHSLEEGLIKTINWIKSHYTRN